MSDITTRLERMDATLREVFEPTLLTITDESHKHAGHAGARPDGETHYRIVIQSDQFSDKGRVETHRMINEALKDEFDTGLHALAISARGNH